MGDAIIVPSIAVILAIVFLFYLGSEGSRTFEAVFSMPVKSESTATASPSATAQGDPFSLRSYAGIGLSLVPVLVGALFLAFRIVRIYKEARQAAGSGKGKELRWALRRTKG